MSKILRAAMIGIGSMGRGHLDNYLRLEKEGYPIKVVALCDIDEKKFTNYKADFNIGEVGADGYDFGSFSLYTDLDEMLKKEELDMVTIALPTYLHCWGTCKCLEAGINRARGFNNKGILNEYRKPKAAYYKVKELYKKFKNDN